MDDLYFRNRQNPNGQRGGRHQNPNQLNEKSAFDFDETIAGTPEPFVVHLPQEELPPDRSSRTPRGQRVTNPNAAPAANAMRPPAYVPQPRQTSPQGRPAQNRNVPPYYPARPATPPQNRQTVAQPPVRKSTDRALENAQTMAIPLSAMKASTQRPARAQNPVQRPAQKSAQRTAPAQKKGRPKKRRSKGKIAALVVLILFLTVLLVTGGGLMYGYHLVGNLNYDTDFVDSNAYIDEDTLLTKKSVTNILLIGTDARDYDPGVTGGRSDTMILCSIDNKHHCVKLTSFLRDAFVTIPSKGNSNRLNAAYSFGGPQLLVDTIEYNFKIKIDGYLLVDFEGFAGLIDQMGGLDVEGVTAAEAKYLRETVKILYAKEGTNHFSGKAALWYCRIRKLDDDIHRAERQRKVIGALVAQAKSMGPAKLLKLVGDTLPNLTTSLKQSKAFSAAIFAAMDYLGGDNPQFQIPAEGTWKNATISGMAVLTFDTEENAKLLQKFIYE